MRIADPGGQFATEDHRRILAHIPTHEEDPLDAWRILERVSEDVWTTRMVSVEELQPILNDLASDGYIEAVENPSGWRMTGNGYEQLCAPVLVPIPTGDGKTVIAEPPPMEGKKLEVAERKNKEWETEHKQIEEDSVQQALKEAEAAVEEIEEIQKTIQNEGEASDV